MPLDQRYIEELVFKFQQGSIEPDEMKILTDWYNSHDDQEVRIPGELSLQEVKDRMLGGLLDKVRAHPDRSHTLKKEAAFSLRWLVAAIVLIAGVGAWVLWNQQAGHTMQPPQSSAIKPGGNKATLTLAGGRTIDLNTGQSGIVVGETITYADGTALVQIDPGTKSREQLTLSTPKGGMYQITLSDGTKVWLNSASSIRYPAQFSPTERIVELTGEAYFEVKALKGSEGNKVPFRVRSKQQEIVVLGTEFNISAYPDERYTKTTLIEGKVLVKGAQEALTLRPGEQATTNQGQTSVQAVQTQYATAWRDGKFSFNGKSFQEIMQEIARWYDLRVVYENGIPDEEIVGDAFRNQDLTLVLRLLDAVSIDYTLDADQRKLIIKGEKTVTH